MCLYVETVLDFKRESEREVKLNSDEVLITNKTSLGWAVPSSGQAYTCLAFIIIVYFDWLTWFGFANLVYKFDKT